MRIAIDSLLESMYKRQTPNGGAFLFQTESLEKEEHRKVLRFKQHILADQIRYCPIGNTIRGSVFSLTGAGLNCFGLNPRMEEHMS